eukprot:1384226-Lingulodinium_polyedra.AAC.1
MAMGKPVAAACCTRTSCGTWSKNLTMSKSTVAATKPVAWAHSSQIVLPHGPVARPPGRGQPVVALVAQPPQ